MRKYEVAINNKQYSVVVKHYNGQNAELEINGKPYMVKLDAPISSTSPGGLPQQAAPVQPIQPVQPAAVQQAPQAPPAAQPAPAQPAPATPPPAAVSAGAEVIKAPIPGSVLEILVKEGDAVKDGQTVVKMEAMKMENDINATCSGTVKSILVNVGDAVNQGQDLMAIE